jgi:phage shock protein A
MADTGLAIQRARDKTEQMQARASAIEELTASGSLDDFTSDQTALDRELSQMSQQGQVDRELEAMKASLSKGAPQGELPGSSDAGTQDAGTEREASEEEAKQ